MKVREIINSKKDYVAFVKLLYRTKYSFKLGKKSNRKNKVDPCDPIPNYNKFCNILKFDPYQYFVLENDDKKIIGLAQISENEIHRFTIDRKHQLSGNGRFFYKFIENIIQKSGADSILLICYFPGSMVFWEKMGFKNHNIIFTKEL